MTTDSPFAGHLLAGGLDGLHLPVVVIGGGQAGLSASWWLNRHGVEHVVLEKHRVGHEWAQRRWDTFCLVTPNYQCRLPGFAYEGDDPDGFMLRDEVVEHLREYVRSFNPPLHEGVTVQELAHDGRRFTLATTRGDLTADQVVLAVGPYQTPRIPALSQRLPGDVVQLHSSQYRNPGQLPEGAVLVVGTGQSGCQIAEDLHLAGRSVHLATGSAPRVARRYRGRDCMTWLEQLGHYDLGIDQFADQESVRHKVNHYVTGRDGGRDLDLRALARDGMQLYGRLLEAGHGDGVLGFADDLVDHLDGADAVAEGIKDLIDTLIARHGIEAPTEPRYTPVWQPDPAQDRSRLDLAAAGITSVVWSTGFTRDDSWISLPVFDGRGYPQHSRGETAMPGLYLLGMPWQWTWGSGRFLSVGADAEHVVGQVLAHARTRVAA